MQIPRRKSDELKIRDESPIYLTPEGIRRLQERLDHLKKAIPDLASEAARTAAYGDRSDSAEYKEAKSALRRAHRQIFSMEDQLKRAVEIKSGRNSKGTIQLGSTVVLKLNDGTQKTFEIVGTQETNPEKGRISYQSPLGATLLKHSAGETITIQTPAGSKEYRILEIR